MKKKNFDKLEKRYLISKGINKYFVENESRWNDFNEILIIKLWVMFQNKKKYNRKTLKIEKDGFFFIKRKEKKMIKFRKYKNWREIIKTINCTKKANFYYKKSKKKIKENILRVLNVVS